MGPRWRKKSSEKLRKGRLPSEGLALVARDEFGTVIGTVRLWDVAVGISPLEGEMSRLYRDSPGTAGIDGIARDTGGTEGVGPAACDLVSAMAKEMPGSADRTPPGGFAATLPSRGRESRVLLLGPLAVEPTLKNAGIGSALMREAIAEAKRLGDAAILLVGDAPYYARFGFSAEKTGKLAMPGPYEKHRLLALELVPGALGGAEGIIRPAGRKAKPAALARAV